MMGATPYEQLSRREREMMDIIYEREEATAAEVHEHLADPPSYSAVRATLRILEEKGCVRHRREGRRYVFRAVTARKSARKKALGKVVKTFFEGSPEQAFAALLDMSDGQLGADELARLSKLVDKARKEGR